MLCIKKLMEEQADDQYEESEKEDAPEAEAPAPEGGGVLDAIAVPGAPDNHPLG